MAQMAAKNRVPTNYLISSIHDGLENASFFQTVRLIEKYLLMLDKERSSQFDKLLPIQFTNNSSFCFQSVETNTLNLVKIKKTLFENDSNEVSRFQMVVSFLGLGDLTGIFPEHLQQLLIKRSREKDFTLQSFLNIFNHHFIKLYYETWKKYRFDVLMESSQCGPGKLNSYQKIIYGVSGNLTLLQKKQSISFDDNVHAYFASFFSRKIKTISHLKHLLLNCFKLPILLKFPYPSWLNIPSQQYSRLGGEKYCALGSDSVIGQSVYSIRHKFLIAIGPLNYQQYVNLLPGSLQLKELVKLTAYYIGISYQFDVELTLDKKTIPSFCLGDPGKKLGWNVWLKNEFTLVDNNNLIIEYDTLKHLI